jgi:hypothetical protein
MRRHDAGRQRRAELKLLLVSSRGRAHARRRKEDPSVTLIAIHVLISLIAFFTGAAVVQGVLAGKLRPKWTAWFLSATALTCVSGFLLPFSTVTPAVAVGILTLVVVSVVAYALFGAKAAGRWAAVFVIGAVATEYFNTLVVVAQSFKHVAPLSRLAPTGAEPPVAITQGIVLVAFVVIAVLAIRRSRGGHAAVA